jgi:hypothetical protein
MNILKAPDHGGLAHKGNNIYCGRYMAIWVRVQIATNPGMNAGAT